MAQNALFGKSDESETGSYYGRADQSNESRIESKPELFGYSS